MKNDFDQLKGKIKSLNENIFDHKTSYVYTFSLYVIRFPFTFIRFANTFSSESLIDGKVISSLEVIHAPLYINHQDMSHPTSTRQRNEPNRHWSSRCRWYIACAAAAAVCQWCSRSGTTRSFESGIALPPPSAQGRLRSTPVCSALLPPPPWQTTKLIETD